MKIIASNSEHRETLRQTGFWGKQGAGCLFLSESSGRFLISLRSSFVEQPLTWGTWGGALDGNETPQKGMRREIKEETGFYGAVRLIPLYIFKHNSGFQFFNFLGVVKKEFTPSLDWETKDFSWVEYGEWPRPLHFGLEKVLKDSASVNKIKRELVKIKGKQL